MNNIFDSHAHYDSDAFDADRKELLSALPEQGVCGIINCGSDMASSLKSLELADELCEHPGDCIIAAAHFIEENAEAGGGGYFSTTKSGL